MTFLIKQAWLLAFGFLLASCGNEVVNTGTELTKDMRVSDKLGANEPNPQALTETPTEEAGTNLSEFVFIADNVYLVVSPSADTNWAKGTTRLHASTGSNVYAAITDVKVEALPAVYANLLHKPFKVCGSGQSFDAKLKSFKLLSEFIPHFGQVQNWDGIDGDKFTDAQKALDIRRSAPPCLVAEFDIVGANGNVGDLYFAVPKDKPTPTLLTALTDSTEKAKLKKQITDIIGKTYDYETVQKEYVKLVSETGAWWKDADSWETFSFFNVNATEGYAVINHTSGNPCGHEFYAEKFSIWKISANSLPTLLCMMDGAYSSILATDIDGNNSIAFLIDDGIGHRSLLKKVGKEWVKVYSWTIPYQDCPC